MVYYYDRQGLLVVIGRKAIGSDGANSKLLLGTHIAPTAT